MQNTYTKSNNLTLQNYKIRIPLVPELSFLYKESPETLHSRFAETALVSNPDCSFYDQILTTGLSKPQGNKEKFKNCTSVCLQ